MDKLIPIGILLGIAIIGFVSKFLELGDIHSDMNLHMNTAISLLAL